MKSSSVEIFTPRAAVFAFFALLAGAGAWRALADEAAGSPAAPAVILETGWLLEDPDGSVRLVAGVAPSGAATTQLLTGRFRYEGPNPAAGLRIVLPIPGGMHYLEGSASGPGASISFSADGGQSFAELHPPAAQLTHIRWDLAGEFEPGVAGLVSFQVRPAEAASDTGTLAGKVK